MLKVKVCGIRSSDNAMQVSSLLPDYLGFIFHKSSKRYVGELADCSWIKDLKIKQDKIGVFVNQEALSVIEIASALGLKGIQLHGDESVEYCKQIKLKLPDVNIWKVFVPAGDFNFGNLKSYNECCDMLLFDSKGGGSGISFDWSLLRNYDLGIPYGIAGGIGVDNIDYLMKTMSHDSCFHLVDINSKVEDSSGFKSPHLVKEVIDRVRGFQR